MEQFKKQISNIFDISYINQQLTPIECFTSTLPKIHQRINHYCIKLDNDDQLYLEGLDKEMQEIIFKIITFSKKNKFPLDRYIYLTLDNKIIEPLKTQRTPGWHLDGFQGEEVTNKQEADYQFILFNKHSPEFSIQNFKIQDFDEKKHNIFTWLSKQVKHRKNLKNNTVYLMNPYMLHRSVEANTLINDRYFFRLSFSKVPITSTKMTINPHINYNYSIHSTSGNIPSHLV